MTEHDDLLRTARERLSSAIDADLDNRRLAEHDLLNLTGEEQWDERVRKARDTEGRPCLTSNQLPRFARQVTGDIRQMNPSITVVPSDGAATKEMADIYEGLIRHIQYRSDATSVYEGAGETAAQCGMGAFRVTPEYENEQSFNQDIRLTRIQNPFAVFWDPNAVMPTREDAEWCMITANLSEDEFKAAYPEKAFASVDSDGVVDNEDHWRVDASVIIAEYFYITRKKAKLVMLRDGRVLVDPKGPIAEAIAERETEIPTVMWCKISGVDMLEGPREFPSKYIPVIAVMGEELHVGRRVYRSSVIRHAIDDQRLFNYAISAQAEVVALQPKAPYMVTAKQVQGLEKFWNAANQSNRPYLPYNSDPAAPPPQRVMPPVSSAGNMDLIRLASENMKSTTGIYDASLGQRSQETSGVAIRQRQMESDVSTSIYSDNVAKAVAHCGRILVDMIPRIFDTARVIRIVGKDDAETQVPVNMPIMRDGVDATANDLSQGQYDVRIGVGPNYTTKRQQSAETLMELASRNPQLMQVAGDLVVKNMDFAGADQLAERLEKTLPPELRPQDDAQQQDPQAMQAAQMQMQAQQDQMQMQRAMSAAQLATEQAKAAKAASDAKKSEFEAQEAELKLRSAAYAASMGLSGQMGQEPV